MREANWDEIFQKPAADDGTLDDERLSSVFPWEDWLTFAILAIGFMSVVFSIDRADWVDSMPSLYPIGFSGLMVGYVLSRIRRPEFLLHPVALLAGATLVYLQAIAIIPGGSIVVRTDALVDRMHIWWSAVTQGGISDDPLPFIVLMLVLVWTGAFASSWAVFRWRNPWLGLVPGGTALMWNISFLPGQYSDAFLVFVFAAVLLVMRVHVAHREEEWDRRGVVYPEFISLSVLHVCFWVAIVLVLLVGAMPLADRSDKASERWNAFTAPLTDRLTPLARVFISVDSKKPIDVHNLKDALPFQGKIKLSDRQAVEIDVEITPELAAYLRAQSYDEYTSSGWKINVEGNIPLSPGERTDVTPAEVEGARAEVTVNVTIKGDNDEILYSLGQPLESDQAVEASAGADSGDIASLDPSKNLGDGDTYAVTGSVSVATPDQLAAAGTDYPDWVTDRYLDLPRGFPRRVERKAEEVTRGADTPYDQAVAIERYLRTFPVDYDLPSTPPGRDTVDYFLFDLQRGYFDYHASAMAVMLRSLGVPSRVAAGYAIDPLTRESDTNTYALTERNAFAWPEVYFPGIGWVEFSPTPSQPLIQRPGAPLPVPDAGAADPNTRGLEEGEFAFPEDPVEPPIDGAPAAGGDGGSSRWPLLAAMALGGAAIAGLVAGGRFAWEFGLSGLSRPAQLWEKTRRLARWANAGAQPTDTPREFARRLHGAVPEADGVVYISAAYERNRFGGKQLNEEETERLESAWAAVRNQLLRRIVRRSPRRS